MIAACAGPRSWPRYRWIILIALVFAAHVGLIAAFNDRTPIQPRAGTPVLHLRQFIGADEWLALNDPTLFVLPHAQGFTGTAWREMPKLELPVFTWADPPLLLELPTQQLGQDFTRFIETNRFAGLQLEANPPPPLAAPMLAPEPALPARSTLRLEGDLARLRLLNPPALPSVTNADLIAPSRVQVRVDTSGAVLSAVLLTSDNPLDAPTHDKVADELALRLAKVSRFERPPVVPSESAPNPAARLIWGRIIYQWHTVPPRSTNAPVELQH